MKIIVISDTHGLHNKFENLPDGDMIIHCGDISSMGTLEEVANFMNWFSNLNQYKYKLCIAGNHDWLFYDEPYLAKSIIPKNVIYLENNGVEIEGIKFYGTPYSPMFCNWAFMAEENKLKEYWELIPNDIDVLITHTPPFEILDRIYKDNAGSITLTFDVLNRIKPKFHLFGHIHDEYGVFVEDGITFINASNCNDNYKLIHEPRIIEI